MKYIFVVFLLMSIPASYATTANPGGTVQFYITDDTLNRSHKGIDVISTSGLVDFTINGIPISGPSSMTETSVDSGVFILYLTIPTSVNGKPLKDGDVIVMTYHQQADYSGNPRTLTQSVTISQSQSAPPSSSQDRVRVGQTFQLKLYAPNWNLDSLTPDTIPLDLVEVRVGGFTTTLANPAFYIPTYGIRETGPNTDLFVAPIKIPKQIDGVSLDIGSTIEFSFKDPTVADSGTTKITLGIGYTGLQNVTPSIISEPGAPTIDSIKAASKIWCDGNVGSSSFVKIVENLESGKYVTAKSSNTVQIPSWFKNIACWWSDEKISDSDFLSGLQFSLDKGFLKIK